MKWIRTAVTVVIMVVSVTVIALGINNLTQEAVKEEVVTFEVLTFDEQTTEGTVTSGTHSKIMLYTEIDNDNHVTNVLSVLINEIEFLNDYNYLYIAPEIHIYDSSEGDYDLIRSDDSLVAGVNLGLNDTVEITFKVTQPPILTGTIAIILGLVPLIVASGVLYFMLRKNNLGD